MSLAVLVVLESLSPLERAVFVLRDVFGLSYGEVAGALERSEAAVRQVAHRAREHVEARRPRFQTDRVAQRTATERFLAACAQGDLGALVGALAPGVTLVTDGGGKAKAALRPIVGADKVARFLVAIMQEGVDMDMRVEITDVNGAPGVVGWTAEGPNFAAQLMLVDSRVERIYIVRNPDKLAGLVHTSR